MQVEYDVDTLILAEDRDIVNLIIQYKGIVYGGYLRDIFGRTSPTDIDCVLWSHQEPEFIEQMELLGYTLTNSEHGCNLLSKSGSRSVEFYSIPYEEDCYLTPVTEPDFYVNTLMFDGKYIRGWCHDDPVTNVIDHIKSKRGGLLGADDQRKTKMLNKGYSID